MSEVPGALSAEDVLFLKTQYEVAHSAVRREVRQFSQADWTYKPNADTWCAAEIVEHIVLVERAMLSRISRHMKDVPNTQLSAAQSQALQRRLLSTLPSHGKVTATEAMSKFSGLGMEPALMELLAISAAFSGFLDSHAQLPLKAISWDHSMFGSLTAFHWLLYIPLHTLRHAGQLARIDVNSSS